MGKGRGAGDMPPVPATLLQEFSNSPSTCASAQNCAKRLPSDPPTRKPPRALHTAGRFCKMDGDVGLDRLEVRSNPVVPSNQLDEKECSVKFPLTAALVLLLAIKAEQSLGAPKTPTVSGNTNATSEPAASPNNRSAESMDGPIVMRPIGVIRFPYKDAEGTPVQGVFGGEVEAFVELKEKYFKGLKDLDGFSHAILLYHFHKSDKEEIVGKPCLEGKEHGIFAIRSPNRPNHIGLSVVKIKQIEGNKLHFTEVDVLDGTPVLDIKPYVKQFDSRPNAVSGWVEKHYEGGKQPAQRTAK